MGTCSVKNTEGWVDLKMFFNTYYLMFVSSVYACVCVYEFGKYVYICAYVCTFVRMCVHLCVPMCVCTLVCSIFAYACVHLCVCYRECVCVCISVCVSVCMCVYVSVSVCEFHKVYSILSEAIVSEESLMVFQTS